MHNSSIIEKARKLRLQGHSYREINRALEISKSTLHSWLAGLQISQKAKERIEKRASAQSRKGLLKRNKRQTHLARQRANKNKLIGKRLVPALSKKNLLLVGAALYWGEGYKKEKLRDGIKLTHHPVSLSNSDPELIRVFLKFLQTCFKVEDKDIRLELHLYEHINEAQAREYWQQVTGLPENNIYGVYYGASISSQRRRKFNRLPYGTAQVRVNSTPLYHQIMGLIEGLISKY